ncbi:hypothetical protein MTR67_038545 [Solanum verrucosum]|uniref:DUF4283 domain-containing protein n=1 Tax=Solanum verrucosum TaxID=315347 RepID=A0AAF0UFE3_SOLVR|nr:hypothetical protein MTR67_038545 [Solanum verrucosum]
MMKEIGDACGGWLENEEETELKNHLRWARIRVRGPKEKIPTSIEVADGDLIYSLPIWCELPALYRKKQEASLSREVEIEPGFRSSNILAQRSEALHKNGRLADGAGTSKLDLYEKGGNSADRNHVAGHVKFLNSQDQWVCPRNYMRRENISGAHDLIADGLSNGLTKGKPNEIPLKPTSAAFKSGPEILNFTEPFIEAIMEKNLPENRNFVNFDGDREIEFDKGGIPLARRGRGKKNGTKHKQKFKEGDNLAIQKTAESKQQRTGEEIDFSDAMVVMYADSEPVPIQIDSSNQERDVEATANEWVQANMITNREGKDDRRGSKEQQYNQLNSKRS